MIIVDMSQLIVATVAGVGEHPNVNPYKDTEVLCHHLIYNRLRQYNVKFKKTYGSMVIACESRRNWRYDTFKYYKSKRKEDKKDTTYIDWDRLYKISNNIIDILKTTFPYPVLSVDDAEGDDIIFCLAKYCNEQNVIISSDKDFLQCLSNHNIALFCPRKEKFRTLDVTPTQFLLEHILGGDSSDGIPNVLSPDDHFINGTTRQKAITKKYKEEFIGRLKRGELTEEEIANFKRNSKLIDLQEIPKDIKLKILETFENYKIEGSMQKVMSYFIESGFSNFLDCIYDFS